MPPRLCNPHGVASLHFSKVAEPAILNRLKSGKSVVSQTALAYSSVGAMSALGQSLRIYSAPAPPFVRC